MVLLGEVPKMQQRSEIMMTKRRDSLLKGSTPPVYHMLSPRYQDFRMYSEWCGSCLIHIDRHCSVIG